ncbi:hypothetical protein BJ742DRAFT_884546 [Cladochytrium replicatum]|nr:hypothetical protein BJ742DRAFT_884546 [Cladochytrium replicatum]
MNGISGISAAELNLEDFEEFVESYTSKFNAILRGEHVHIDDDDTEPPAKLDEPVRETQESEETAKETGDQLEKYPDKMSRSEPKKYDALDYSRWERIDDTEDGDPAPAENAPAEKKKTRAPQETLVSRVRNAMDQLRREGNECVRRGKFSEAETMYTNAIHICESPTQKILNGRWKPGEPVPVIDVDEPAKPSPNDEDEILKDPFSFLDKIQFKLREKVVPDASIYTNRALVRLKLERFEDAASDCVEALKLSEATGIRGKALWRQAEGYRGMKDFGHCIDCLDQLRSMAVEYNHVFQRESRKTKNQRKDLSDKDPGVSLKEITHMIETVRNERDRHQAKSNLENVFDRDGSRRGMAEMLDTFVGAIARIKPDGSGSPGDGQSEEWTSAQLASQMLCDLLSSHIIIPSLFGLSNGFELLLDEHHLNSTTIGLILPVLLGACSTSTKSQINADLSKISQATGAPITPESIQAALKDNRIKMSTSLDRMFQILLGMHRPDVDMISRASQLLAACAEEDEVKELLCRSSTFGAKKRGNVSELGNFVLAFLDSETISTAEQITHSLLRFLVSILMYGRDQGAVQMGPHTVIHRWGIGIAKLLAALPRHIETGMLRRRTTSEKITTQPALALNTVEISSSVGMLACQCLHALSTVEHPTKSAAFKKHGNAMINPLLKLVEALVSHRKQSVKAKSRKISEISDAQWEQLCTTVLASSHNVLMQLDTLPAEATQEPFVLNLVFLASYSLAKVPASPSEIHRLDAKLIEIRTFALSTLGKLVVRSAPGASIATQLDGWWDDLEPAVIWAITSSSAIDRNGTLPLNAALQVLSFWLKLSPRNIVEWSKPKSGCRVGPQKEEGTGFTLLVHMLLRAAQELDSGNRELSVFDDTVIGNLALCVAECATKTEHAKWLCMLGIIEPIVTVLRNTRNDAAQKNVAKACAKLCQIGPARQKIRELGGMDVMLTIGA